MRPPQQDLSAGRFWEAPGMQQRISPVNGRGGVECLVPLALSLSLNLTPPRWRSFQNGEGNEQMPQELEKVSVLGAPGR